MLLRYCVKQSKFLGMLLLFGVFFTGCSKNDINVEIPELDTKAIEITNENKEQKDDSDVSQYEEKYEKWEKKFGKFELSKKREEKYQGYMAQLRSAIDENDIRLAKDTNDELKKLYKKTEADYLQNLKLMNYYSGMVNRVERDVTPDGFDAIARFEGGYYGEYDYKIAGDSIDQYAVMDIDKDGRKELLITISNAYPESMYEYIYEFDPKTEELMLELQSNSDNTYYDNGYVVSRSYSDDSVGGVIWPYTLYKYDEDAGIYNEVGYAISWDVSFLTRYDEANAQYDLDGDGIVYEIYDEEYNSVYCDKDAYDQWCASYQDGASEMDVNWTIVQESDLAKFSTEYGTLLLEKAKKLTKKKCDIGIQYVEAGFDFEPVIETLEKEYDVQFQGNPDVIDREGLYKDECVIEIYAYDAHKTINYKDRKLKDVTIFGIYPGMEGEKAKSKMTEMGFYLNYTVESSFYYFSGLRDDDISISFTIENGKVQNVSIYNRSVYD